MSQAELDREILEVGRGLAAALPSRSRHPLKALDAKAMDFAASDQELRAALFRFVDVTPACRSLDDLAAHLTGFLEEVGDRPPSLDAAMRMSTTKPGRTALGVLKGLWKRGVATSVDLLGEATVTETEADRYAARCADALDTLANAYAGW